jgi:hypothetical protein
MNARFTTLIAAIALIGLAISAGTLTVLLTRPQTAQGASQTPIGGAQVVNSAIRQITVVGQGEAKGAPDTASIQLGVQTESATAREALTSNNTQMQALVAKLKELGIADKDIQTSNIAIYPRYDNNGRAVEAYQVSNTVTVRIRDITATGALLDQVVDAGANNINGISFMINDPRQIQQTARDAAIADARARAEAMAKAAGVTLGQVLAISETVGQPVVPLMARAEAAMAADASVPIQSGEQTINAQVQMTFELK